MGVRLVRKSSETPNIENKDDARMIRYAYGGYDGVIKGYGQELSYTFENSVFKIGSGRIVVQGWEADVDESGWNLNLSGITGTRYYVVYLEMNLVTQKAEIKSEWSTSTYPSVLPGDDLTTYPNGIARILLYSFKLTSGSFSLTTTGFPKISYLKEWIAAILRSLNETENSILAAFESGEIESKYAVYAFGGDDSKGTIEERLESGLLKSYTASNGSITISEKGIYAVYYHDPSLSSDLYSSAVLCIPDLSTTVIDASMLVKYDSSTKTIVRYRTNAVVHAAYLIARL